MARHAAITPNVSCTMSDIRISKQRVQVAFDATHVTFNTSKWQSKIPLADVEFVATLPEATYLGLLQPYSVSPKRKHPDTCMVIQGLMPTLPVPTFAPEAVFSSVATDDALAIDKSGIVVVASGRSCGAFSTDEIEPVVLQRTTGGMSTFDVHVLPKDRDKAFTVDHISHEFLAVVKRALDPHTIDVGGDPVMPARIQGKWQVPSQPASSSSDDESGSEYDPNEPEYESTESEIECESCDDE